VKLTKSKLKQIIREELETLSVPEDPDTEENYVKLVNALGDILRHSLDEVGMEYDEIHRAVEEALETELGSDVGKILARGGQF